jgi:hypothetical protein
VGAENVPREGDENLVGAGLAADAGEAMGEDAAAQVAQCHMSIEAERIEP